MHKDELIQLHTLLCQVKHHLERQSSNANGRFIEYEKFGVSPQHIHKSKMQHKRAVFLLGRDLAETLSGADEFSNAHKVGMRMGELAKKVSKGPPMAAAGTSS
jgi:hypothetical protein